MSTTMRNRKGKDGASAGAGAPMTPKDKIKRAHADHEHDHDQACGNTPKDRQEHKRVQALIELTKDHAPPWLSNVIVQMAPALRLLFLVLAASAPYVVLAWQWGTQAYSTVPVVLCQALYGLCVCFFGGMYPASLAALEAFKVSGGDTIRACVADLMEDYKTFMAAHKEDDERDDDGDGIADVEQISSQELAQRKVLLALRTVNPERVTTALGGLYSGFLGILCVLKFEFARTVTLGVSIANALRKPAARYLVPALVQLIPKEYHQWIDPIVNYSCKAIAVTFAWWIQRIISTVQSAIMGGLLAARYGLKWANAHGYVQVNMDESFADEALGWSLAFCGVWFQWSMGWSLPFPMNLLLFPLTIVEWLLEWSVTFLA